MLTFSLDMLYLYYMNTRTESLEKNTKIGYNKVLGENTKYSIKKSNDWKMRWNTWHPRSKN